MSLSTSTSDVVVVPRVFNIDGEEFGRLSLEAVFAANDNQWVYFVEGEFFCLQIIKKADRELLLSRELYGSCAPFVEYKNWIK